MTGTSTVTAVDASVSRGTGDLQMLVFLIKNERFAVPLTEIQEIMTIMPLTPVPHAPNAIRGIVNVRGKVATAVDIARVLGFDAATNPQYMIMAKSDKNLLALLVDTVVGVLRTSAEHLRTTPDLFASKSAAAYIGGALVIPKEDTAQSEHQTDMTDATGLGDSDIILTLNLSSVFAAVATPSAR